MGGLGGVVEVDVGGAGGFEGEPLERDGGQDRGEGIDGVGERGMPAVAVVAGADLPALEADGV